MMRMMIGVRSVSLKSSGAEYKSTNRFTSIITNTSHTNHHRWLVSNFHSTSTNLEKIHKLREYHLHDKKPHLPQIVQCKFSNEQHPVSWVHGISNTPLIDDPIGVWFENQVRKFGDDMILNSFYQNAKYSWSSLNEEVNRVCLGLKKLGLTEGDRLAICLPNCKEWLIMFLACCKLSIITVNINPASQLPELKYALNLSGAKALLIKEHVKKTNYVHILNQLIPSLTTTPPNTTTPIHSDDIPSLHYIIHTDTIDHKGMIRYDEILMSLDAYRESSFALNVSNNAPVNIQFTSGTTGKPKGATLSHSNILNNGYFCGERMNLSKEDQVCVPVPLFHCFGLVLGTLAGMTHNACVIYPSEFFDAETVMKVVHDTQCSVLHGVPTMFAQILSHPKFSHYSYHNLRTGIMAGTTCPIEYMKKVIELMNMREITIAYGMTETSPVSFQTYFSLNDVTLRTETIGLVHPHCEVKIVNEENEIVPIGQIGELCTRGYNVMLGYWDNPSQTEKSIVNGWMHTGDLATIDHHGYARIVGRKKDMIIRGGENIYPREVEETYLELIPDIIDIQVFGVSDPFLGEEVCAWVLLKEKSNLTAKEIKERAKGKLSHYKIPKYIHIVSDKSEIPMTLSGKPQKYILRQLSEKLFNLSS